MAKSYRAARINSSSLPLAAPFAMLALLMSPQCRADWKVNPAVDLRQSYTDNVLLAPDESARGQFVTDLTPSLSIANNGPRLKLLATLATHLYAYSGEQVAGTNKSARQFSADAKGKLVEDLLFFEGSGAVSQQAISAFGPQVNSNNGYSNANRAEVRTWRVSPYLAHRFGAQTAGELRFTRDSVKPGMFGLGESTANTVSMSIAGGAQSKIGWGLQYMRQDLDDSLAKKSRNGNAGANLRLRVSETLSLTANGGYDKYEYPAPGGTTAGKSYALGFGWTPSPRTSIQANAGKRYYGSSYFLNASHRSRNSVWSVNYNDAVTTARSQFLLPATVDTASLLDRLFMSSIADPLARQQAVAAYMRATGLGDSLADSINYFSNRFLLQKQLQAAVAVNGSRSTAILSLNANKRTALSTQQSDSALLGSSLASLNDNTRQVGATAALNYRISARSGANLVLSKNRAQSLSTGLIDNQAQISLALTRQLTPKIRSAVEMRHSQGNAATQGGRTYRENAISASLSLQL